MERTVKLYYAKIQNMGDLLNELILEKCFGLQVERHSFLTGELCAIGSCLGQYTLHGTPAMRFQQRLNGAFHPEVSIWSTGFIRYTDCESPFFKKRMHFFAVRGELTRRNIETMTGQSQDIPTGDAGLFASRLLPHRPSKRYSIGIVPHVCDIGDEKVKGILRQIPDACLIDVRNEPLQVLSQIAACEHILSSSLHGLVVADSFGIPNRHLIFSDRLLGDGFKFDDYYSAFDLPHRYTDLRQDALPSLDQIRSESLITQKMVLQKQAELECTFPLREGLYGI